MSVERREGCGVRCRRGGGALLLGVVLAGAPAALAAPIRAAVAPAAPTTAPPASGATTTAAAMPATTPPTAEALQVITTSAKRIASYHEAVARTRDRVRKEDPDQADTVRFLVVLRGSAWHVLVLQKNTTPATEARGWLLLADAGFMPAAGEVTTYQKYEPMRSVPPDGLAMLQALEVASAAAATSEPEIKPPFEESIFKSATRGGPITVYLQTKPAAPGTARFGSDIRADISADGAQMKIIEALHTGKESIEVAIPKKGGGEPPLHQHEEGDLPTDTDVAVVLDHPALAPVLVLTPRFMFRIGEGGTITYLGPNPVPPVDAGGGQ